MSLSSRAKNKLIDVINTTFASLGNANGMRMPRSGNNLEPLAWDLFVAKHLFSLAEKRKDSAEWAAVKAGLIIDKEKNPKPPGTREVIYNGDIVSISLEVRSGSMRVNAKIMREYLISKSVSQKLIDEAEAAASTATRPAHVFTPILITNGE